jgi:hypothetical protein
MLAQARRFVTSSLMLPPPVYANARMIAVKWLNRIKKKQVNWKREHPNWNIERGLKQFFALTEYYRPSHLGVQKSTKRIRDVKNMLVRRHDDYEKLHPQRRENGRTCLNIIDMM